MQKRTLSHPELADPPHFSRAVETIGGRIVWLAGQAPVDGEGKLIGGDDLASQTEVCMGKIAAILEAAGGSMDDVVWLTFYVTDISRLSEIQSIRDKYLKGEVKPAMSGIEVSNLADPRWLVEIDGVAVLPE
jgi:enamine deaminase RidA (YjgF/YER057c/UK114 family)